MDPSEHSVGEHRGGVTLQDARARLESRGLRPTPQRETIYLALLHTSSHPTAEELFHAVRERGAGSPTGPGPEAGLSLATVYNTLEALTRVGLCRRLGYSAPAAGCRYDADTENHAHVVDPEGRMRDVPPDLSERLLASVPASLVGEIEDRLGLKVGGVRIQLEAQGPEADQPGVPQAGVRDAR